MSSRPTALADSLAPLAGQLSAGVVAGAATGYALKVLGRAAAVGFGTLFCCVQAASYAGLVLVDWSRVEAAARHQLLGPTAEQSFTLDDARRTAAKLQDVLEWNLPSGSGFTAGLAYSLGGKACKLAVLGVGGPLAASVAGANAFAASDLLRSRLNELSPGLASRLEAALVCPPVLLTLQDVSRESELLRRAEKKLNSSTDPAARRRLVKQQQALEARRKELLAQVRTHRTGWW